MKKRVAFFDTKPYDKVSFEKHDEFKNYEIVFFETKLTEKSVALAKGFDVVCVFVNDIITEKVIDELYEGGVQLIALRCAGYNNVDVCHAHGKIKMMRVPAYSPYAVAEHALALLMTLNRKIHRAHFRTRDNNFSINGLVGFDLHGKTAGVIGAGKIGKIMAGILKGVGMNVVLFDKYQDQEWADNLGVRYVELDELYRISDVISLHCPLLPTTHHIVNDESIAKMKDGVILINTSRGPLIDTNALIKALKTQKIGAAGLDVYEEEGDYFFEDFSDTMVQDDVLARLLTFPNVIITSHQAFLTKEALENISDTTFTNIRDFFNGVESPNEICGNCENNNCPKHKKGAK